MKIYLVSEENRKYDSRGLMVAYTSFQEAKAYALAYLEQENPEWESCIHEDNEYLALDVSEDEMVYVTPVDLNTFFLEEHLEL